MATTTLSPGENVLIRLGLFIIADGLTDKGAWDSVTAYVADDVVTDNYVGYKCILANTNQQPPNITYWEPLPIVDVDDILKIEVRLINTESVAAVTWLYVADQPIPVNLTIVDGLLTVELLAADSANLLGVYDLEYLVTLINTDYMSGGQTDAVCVEDLLEFTLPCNPVVTP